MLIRFDWLRELVDLPESAEEVAEVLTGVGLAVDGIEAWGETSLFDIDVTANRGDAMNHRGVARELAAALGRDLAPLETAFPPTDAPAGERARVEIEDDGLCHRYTARIVEDLAMGTSPPWLEDRLESLGLRALNNVVDATNYVLLEMGQPMHTFDLDKLAGATVIVRRARKGETLVTLDEEERRLGPEDLIIADAQRPVALAGIMGGLETMISEDTTRILLESAWFHPGAIRATAKRLGMRTDASIRFERGCDPEATLPAADRFCNLMEKHLGGGRFLKDPLDVRARRPEPGRAPLRWDRAEALIGCAMDRPRLLGVMERLGFEREEGEEAAPVFRIPSWRPDVEREVDLVEEVGRHHGFESIPSSLPASPGAAPPRYAAAERRERLRDASAGAGFLEAVNYAFIDASLDRTYRYREGEGEPLPVLNPLVRHQGVMRGSLLPGLLQAASRNQARGEGPVRLFEFGKRFWKSPGGEPAEEWTAAYLLQGAPTGAVSWERRQRTVDFFDLKGALEQVLEAGAAPDHRFAHAAHPFLHPSESAQVLHGDRLLGPAGRLHPDQEKALDLEGPVYVAELDLLPLLEAEEGKATVCPPSRFPWADRDLSLLLPEEVTYGRVEEAIRSLDQESLADVQALDRWVGEGVPEGKVSLSIRLRYQRADRTLRPDEASTLVEAVVQCLHRELSAELRS